MHPARGHTYRNLRSSSDIGRALTGIANSAEAETRPYRRFTNIKAIPGDSLSDFFGKLQEIVRLLTDTDYATPPRQHRTLLRRNIPDE